MSDITMRSAPLVEPVETSAATTSAEPVGRTPLKAVTGWIIGLAIAQTVIALDVHLPVVRPALALGTLIVLPTFLVLRKVDFPTSSAAARAAYSFGTVLLGVMLVALLLNTVLPALGIERPLQPLVLAVTWFVLDAALLVWRRDRLATTSRSDKLISEARLDPATALACVSVVLAVLGAIRLNNELGGGVALVSLLLAGAAIAVLLAQRGRSVGLDSAVLALVSVGLLLATSLRGWAITGHDIQAEYFAYTLTSNAQHWSMDAMQNAYNACLSINILPTVLSETTDLSGVVVFKVLLQLVFALVPVLTYLVARRFLSRRLALVAAVLVIAFPTFYTDMPYLVRQEVAFFFLALFLLAATEPGRGPRKLVPLAALFGVGVVLSHYSTTYVLLGGLVAGLALWGVVRVVRRRRGDDESGSVRGLVLLNPVLIASLLVACWAWGGPATHTGGHAKEVALAALSTILGDDEQGPASSDVSFFLLAPDDSTPRERLDDFVGETMDARKQAPDGLLVVEDPTRAELRPKIYGATELPLTGTGRAVDSVGLDPSWLSGASRIGAAILIQLLLMAGLASLVLPRRTAAQAARGTEDVTISRELACLAFGAVGMLGLIVLIPSLSVEYGVLRAFQQTLFVVAPVVAAGLWFLVRRLRFSTAIVVAVTVGLFLVLSGGLPTLLGGNAPRLALANSGLYHDRYLASDSDVAQADWVVHRKGAGRGDNPKVIAPRNVGLRMATDGLDPNEVQDRMYPTLLTHGSYVFVDANLAERQRGIISWQGNLITYAYPMKDIDEHLNLVYSSGRSRIYR